MSHHDSNIPSDPEENLRRLKDINEGFRKKLNRKETVLAELKARVKEFTELLAEMPAVEDCSQEEAELAASREQIIACDKFDIDKIEADIKTLKGKLHWNENKQAHVEALKARQEDLKYTMRAKMLAAGVAEESK